ncbi:MAG: AmmeMemoRadiSam system radical SAM enzyme [Candidatus Omnitrophica bacterium]|nr:AmmeMemoRadiSam system radical SAM enzyme [Candidatus Omnitrophota bacterium]
MKEALYYKKRGKQDVQCVLCPKNCIIKPESVGFCKARKNINGKLYSLIYGKTTGIAVDPIEKKPLAQYHPREVILSLGTRGCNLACIFCQNWDISQNPDAYLANTNAEEIIREAKRLHSFGIAYTYNEPFIWYEFILETAKLAKKNNLENVLVTNGYVNLDPLEELLPYIGAMNIDLKALDNDFYKKICHGALDPVLSTIIRAKKDCHIELTNLIIPGYNDTDAHFEKLTDWIFTHTGADTPLHLSRYFPCYELTAPPTPLETLKKAFAIAKKKLKFVYMGNV